MKSIITQQQLDDHLKRQENFIKNVDRLLQIGFKKVETNSGAYCIVHEQVNLGKIYFQFDKTGDNITTFMHKNLISVCEKPIPFETFVDDVIRWLNETIADICQKYLINQGK